MGVVVLPGVLGLEGGGVAYEPVQGGEEGVEGRTVAPLCLPALQHQGVERWGAVMGGGKTILVCYCLHHLEREMEERWRRGGGEVERWRRGGGEVERWREMERGGGEREKEIGRAHV